MKNILLLIFAFFTLPLFSQTIERVDPPNWWTDMKYNNIELLVKGKGLRDVVFSTNEKDIAITDVVYPENPDYVYITLKISGDAVPGIKKIDYKAGRKSYVLNYELKQRNGSPDIHQGINSGDVIYLITPDRFANGDTTNDVVESMREKVCNREEIDARHGGDLRGVINKLDYIKSLGMTATWLNPVEENDMDATSYHGYAFTDHFKVDPRFGTNDEYLEYVEKSHEKGLKVVKDVVYNHFGIKHYLIEDLPSKSWLHNWDEFTRTNYRASTLMDPHASQADRKKMLDGWFDITMPDINQNNIHAANYLIQYSIWWIEEFGLDAFRVDTYPYSDQRFMSRLTKTIYDEYPGFVIFGEAWVTGVTEQAWVTSGFHRGKDFNSYMDGVTDFSMKDAIIAAVKEDFGWNSGVAKIYNGLAWDYMYKDPMANVIFIDNHDLDRFLGVIGGNLQDYKMALGILFTMRGIPQLYYGAEINMDRGGHHGHLRQDFPGGWSDDKTDKFTAEGRSEDENSTWNYISKLANWRLTNDAVRYGKLMQFIPEDNIYVYFRYNDKQAVMVVVNAGKEEKELKTQRFEERTKGFTKAKDVITDKTQPLGTIKLQPRSTTVLELVP